MRLLISLLWQYKWRLLIVAALIAGVYGAYKPLPPEVGVRGERYEVPNEAVTFLVDETYVDAAGIRTAEQVIFDEVVAMIAAAEKVIVVDMFLWNPFQGVVKESHRSLSQELTDALVRKKVARSDIDIVVITDPINTVYGGQSSAQFDALKEAGIPVILTNLSELRDSNPLYSAWWRLVLQWPERAHQALLDTSYTFRLFPNVLDAGGEAVPLRSYLKLFNFKANHRKLIVADAPAGQGREMVSLVTSANPHDGSSMHSNVALKISGSEVWRDLLMSEAMVARLARERFVDLSYVADVATQATTGELGVTMVTEKAILDTVLELIAATEAGDSIDLAMFYLSEDAIIESLVEAVSRGVETRIMLDPNKDAFGREKSGVPNRPVAAYLREKTNNKIDIRWCATTGEQCHGKMLLVKTATTHALMLGSANFTRRNLNNLNLETNLLVDSREPSQAYRDASAYFDRAWNNADGRRYTVAYETYEDASWIRRFQWRIMENSGLSTF